MREAARARTWPIFRTRSSVSGVLGSSLREAVLFS
jgi:hypothetical protein